MASSSDIVYKITSLQRFDGSFNLDNIFCTTIQVNFNSAKSECDRNGWNSNAYAATLALAFFLEKLKHLNDKWELVANKSKTWLIQNFVQQVDAMFVSATKLVNGS